MSFLLNEPVLFVLILLLGLLAGVLGGMLGVGGSVVMIPGLAILFSMSKSAEPNQHLFQACAMIVNVVVSVPAMLRHRKAGALVGDVLIWDQRAVLHRATPWNYDEPRKLSSLCVSLRAQDGLDAMRQSV